MIAVPDEGDRTGHGYGHCQVEQIPASDSVRHDGADHVTRREEDHEEKTQCHTVPGSEKLHH